MMVTSFVVFLLSFAAVGVLSVKFSRRTKHDYYLASQSMPPWLVGLSAVATNNSGYMFIGVIGYTYSTGLAAFWLMFGWILGDFVGSLLVHKKLRTVAAESKEDGYISTITSWQGVPMFRLRVVAALLSFVFLMAYASAQLVAGSKALAVLLNWPSYLGAVVGAGIVLVYCWAGGIRASIWTDAAQSFVMVGAMALLLVSAVQSLGGFSSAVNELNQVPDFMDWSPQELVLPGLAGLSLFILGWLVAGLCVVGQPHIMVRFMALSDTGCMRRARMWYYCWFILFYGMATGVGLLSRILLPSTATFDAELALPTIALQLLHPIFVGLILAGIFAATMSTADSLVLSCSSIVANDLTRGSRSLKQAKWITVLVTAGALGWALVSKQSVFNLVVMSWSTLGSAFVPLLLLLVLGREFSQKAGLGVMLTAVVCALLWRWFGLQGTVFEGLPAIALGLLSYPLWHRLFPNVTR